MMVPGWFFKIICAGDSAAADSFAFAIMLIVQFYPDQWHMVCWAKSVIGSKSGQKYHQLASGATLFSVGFGFASRKLFQKKMQCTVRTFVFVGGLGVSRRILGGIVDWL